MKNKYIINNRFLYYKDYELGNGGFGCVYIGKDLKYNKYVAIKCENINSNRKSVLTHEYYIMSNLKNANIFPIPIWYGEDLNYKFLVMKKYGKDLEFIKKYCNNKFSEKTILMLGIEILNKLKILHFNNIIHRDIKPENFLLDKSNNNIQLIDFGLSKYYIDKNTNEHILMKENNSRTGTLRYMSINSHEKKTLSRRDDLISLSYMLIYFSKGSLPWQGIKSSKDQYQQVHDIKLKSFLNGELLLNLSNPIADLITYSNILNFDDNPDYDRLIDSFKNYCNENNILIDYKWDWLK
tara:strand:- start:1075 stop:1959 length:885 start_codon:yes stop_codon:yes gene_type:complete